MIHFEFIFVYGARSKSPFFFLAYGQPTVLEHSFKRLSFPLLNCLGTSVKNQFKGLYLNTQFCSICLPMCQYHTVLTAFTLQHVLLCLSVLATPHGTWDLGSKTRDRTCAPCSGNAEVLTSGPTGKSSCSINLNWRH